MPRKSQPTRLRIDSNASRRLRTAGCLRPAAFAPEDGDGLPAGRPYTRTGRPLSQESSESPPCRTYDYGKRSYDGWRRQRCWAHILREARYLLREHPDSAAARGLREIVIYHKIRGSLRAEESMEIYGSIFTCVATWNNQGLGYVKEMLPYA